MTTIATKTTTAATTTVTATGKSTNMWDQVEKGYVTDAECIAKNMDVGG
jgi:hypothetical protein